MLWRMDDDLLFHMCVIFMKAISIHWRYFKSHSLGLTSKHLIRGRREQTADLTSLLLFCINNCDDYQHAFIDCPMSANFWERFKVYFVISTNILCPDISLKVIILGNKPSTIIVRSAYQVKWYALWTWRTCIIFHYT